MTDAFPDAWYLLLSSRLVPDLDGGYTISTLARARQMADAGVHGGRGPLLLTVDPGPAQAHAEHRAVFVSRGGAVASEVFRNAFDEAAAPGGGAADWLRAAARAGTADPTLEYRRVAGGAVDLPVIVGDPDWHLSTATIVIRDAAGADVGVVDGFGALYRAWLAHVVSELRAERDRPVVVVCESRQLGELIVEWDDPDVRILHAVHTIHLESPYTADAPVNALWTRWLDVAPRFDAVLWPTSSQRDDVRARFGADRVDVVAPHAVAPAPLAQQPGPPAVVPAPPAQQPGPHAVAPAPPAEQPGPPAVAPAPLAQQPGPPAVVPAPPAQQPGPHAVAPAPPAEHPAPSAVVPAPPAEQPGPPAVAPASPAEQPGPPAVAVLGRLAPGKRLDHALRAFARVLTTVPDARLELWGEGAERAALEALVEDLGIGHAVRLPGLTVHPRATLAAAAVYLSTSAFEGQGLALAEALAEGTPVVAYDIRYGPRDMLARGGGILVPDGDEEALASALVTVLTDAGLRHRLASEARDAAADLAPARAMSRLAAASAEALSRPSRR